MKSPVARDTGIDDAVLATRGSLPGNDHRETLALGSFRLKASGAERMRVGSPPHPALPPIDAHARVAASTHQQHEHPKQGREVTGNSGHGLQPRPVPPPRRLPLRPFSPASSSAPFAPSTSAAASGSAPGASPPPPPPTSAPSAPYKPRWRRRLARQQVARPEHGQFPEHFHPRQRRGPHRLKPDRRPLAGAAHLPHHSACNSPQGTAARLGTAISRRMEPRPSPARKGRGRRRSRACRPPGRARGARRGERTCVPRRTRRARPGRRATGARCRRRTARQQLPHGVLAPVAMR